jgi:ubiquinone/menaquinone biosynthesis C-methylase UbiE
MTTTAVDANELEMKVQAMYRAVAENPKGAFHFEMGRSLAQRLGYPSSTLDPIPPAAVESFAGVGYFFDLAALTEGESVLDLGSGSGMDAFVAASAVGPTGRVAGIDMTPAQLTKAESLRAEAGFSWVSFTPGHIEALPFDDRQFDVVISNGVVNLSPVKSAVFAEAARVLRPGGRLAVADIVSERPLADKIVCNADLWASCIGGAAPEQDYLQAITAAGFRVEQIRPNDYRFLSEQALNASAKYGVKSVSLLARRI